MDGIMAKEKLRVAVLGASTKPERYSNIAVYSLLEHGHEVIPVNPAHTEINGILTEEACTLVLLNTGQFSKK